jgi:hypothetical protein
MINDIIALILAHLPWEEDSDLLLQEYPFAKPQWIRYTSFTTTVASDRTTYKINGVYHRIDDPAVIISYPDGSKTEIYYHYGKIHRIDAPAYISTYPLGYLKYYRYYYNGRLHRLDGPADIMINFKNGTKFEEYWINDHQVDPRTGIPIQN